MTGWEERGGLLEEASQLETSSVVIGIEKSAATCEWKWRRARLFWSVLRLLETGAKPWALLVIASAGSGPTHNNPARPARLCQYTHTVGKARCHSWEEREIFHTWQGGKKRSTLGSQIHDWGWGESRKVAFSWLEKGKDLIALGLFRM